MSRILLRRNSGRAALSPASAHSRGRLAARRQVSPIEGAVRGVLQLFSARLVPIAIAVTATVGTAKAFPGRAAEPTRIETSDDGKTVSVPGETAPRARAKLPLPTVRRTAADKPLVQPKVIAPVVATPAISAPEQVRSAIEVFAGYTYLPVGVLRAIQTATDPSKAQRDQHPQLQGTAIEAGYRWGLSPQSWLVVRAGIVAPNVPDQNWWATSGKPAPLYTEINLVGIELMADYLRRLGITDFLGVYARGGIGLQILAGSATQTETLPNCAAAKAANCATWQHVGKTEVSLPPVLPALRASVGVDLKINSELSLALEGGLRAAPYFGGGVVYAF